MSNSPMIPLFAPDGTLGEVPFEKLHDAISAGGTIARKMQAPTGEVGYIPANRANEAVKAGGKVLPYDAMDSHLGEINWEGSKSAALDTLKNQAKSLISPQNFAANAIDPGGIGRGTMNAVNEAVAGWKRANDPRAKVGEAFLSAIASPFVSAEAQAEHAAKGESNKIVGETAVPALETAAGYGIAKGTSAVMKALPSTEHAGAQLANVKATVGDVPIDMAKPGNTALELWEQSERGANLPSAVRKFVQRATKPGSEPITYEEAKDFQSNVSSLSADEKMSLKPNTKRLLGQLNADLKDSLEQAADTQGKGEQFVKAMKEYHNAMRLGNLSDEVKANLWKAALTSGGIYGAKKIWDAAQ